MKKFINILACLIVAMVAMSCEKFSVENATDEVTISFTPVIESGNIHTKASFSDEVLNTLEYNYPKTITLYGRDNDRVYTLDLTTGDTFSVQKGTYLLSCATGVFDESCHWKANETVPLAVERTTTFIRSGRTYYGLDIEITESKNYTIPLLINGLIIASEKSKVSYLKIDGKSNYLHETENYYFYILAYPMNIICTSYATGDIEIEMGGTEEYETTIITKRTKGDDVVGKYFIYSPNANENRTFDFTIGTWSGGND